MKTCIEAGHEPKEHFGGNRMHCDRPVRSSDGTSESHACMGVMRFLFEVRARNMAINEAWQCERCAQIETR